MQGNPSIKSQTHPNSKFQIYTRSPQTTKIIFKGSFEQQNTEKFKPEIFKPEELRHSGMVIFVNLTSFILYFRNITLKI